eukprot:TRINITY_DN5443_c0_g1_i2.p1 TRINITY_DN5443_c0_g1~~TRINITY_DN5443_c0_g1_i2.p1  ORF type:complete len:141 (+),score=57.94 TRINITY_DN5443_c0_g1_i2:359-781(+)
MAANSIVGTFWRNFMMDGGAEEEAKNYMAVCVVIVTLFAPLGSILSSHFHRHVLAALIYILDTIALVTALIIIPMTTTHIILVVCLITFGFVFFYVLSLLGGKLLEKNMENESSNPESPEIHPPSSLPMAGSQSTISSVL